MDSQDELEHHSNPFLGGSNGSRNNNNNNNNNEIVTALPRPQLRNRKERISRAGWNEDIMMDALDEGEHHHNPFLSSGNNNKIAGSLQFRKQVSMARWDEDMMMGEIIEKKGSWATTGIVRGGKLYCSLEEILFLTERGALILVDSVETVLPLEVMYKKVADGRNGCSWESFLAYRRLKSLGYVVGRHGVAWTSKDDKKCNSLCLQVEEDLNDNGKRLVPVEGSKSNKSIISQLSEMHITELKPDFDVYLPDSKFKKSSPGDPFCLLCIIRGNPPTRVEIERMKSVAKGVPVKFCHVDHWLVNFFSYDKVELPTLP